MRDKHDIVGPTIIKCGNITAWVRDVSWEMNGKMLVTGNSAGRVMVWEEKVSEDNNELNWVEVTNKGISLKDHLKASQHPFQSQKPGIPPSPVISALKYLIIPKSIFKRVREQKEEEEKHETSKKFDYHDNRKVSSS